MTRAVIALGANLGDARAALQGAVDALSKTQGIDVLAASPVYETEPVGGPEQPVYVNAVILIDTSLDPDDLLTRANAIEAEWQRTREVHWLTVDPKAELHGAPVAELIQRVDVSGVRMLQPRVELKVSQ